VLLFLCVVIAVQLCHGDVRELLSLSGVLLRALPTFASPGKPDILHGRQMDGSYRNVQTVADELRECSLHRTAAAAAHVAGEESALELDQVSFS